MNILPLGIEGAWIASSKVHADNRGNFREWFKANEILESTGIDFSVAQANISQSNRGVVRGIHYSVSPKGQAKWITCVTGAIKDVIVDIRPASRTFGEYISVDLIGGAGESVLIGAGLGHAFVSLVEGSTVAYLISSRFSPDEEHEINPLDPDIAIDWGIPSDELLLSLKDAVAPSLQERRIQGNLPSQ